MVWLFIAGLAGCRPTPAAPDVFVISLDTTRADAISAWGLAPAGREDLRGVSITPHIDALAAAGVRYAWAFAHAPSTLASHSNVFTGREPHAVAIPRNGFPLLPGVETLAERMHGLGYTTAAVLGSSALARPMGIDRGFDVWDEHFSVTRTHRHEANATEVTDRALAAIHSQDSSTPVFLFAHYFDAHGPYQAPPPFAGRFHSSGKVLPRQLERLAQQCRNGQCEESEVKAAIQEVRGAYLEEVAYVDSEIGRLLDEPARPNGRIVILLGDHGEMLGENPARPFGHGGDIDPATTHVPLLIVAPGLSPGVIETATGLRDVGTILLRQLGDTTPFGDGAPSSSTASTQVYPREIPMEATQPGNAAPGWNNRDNERGMVYDDRLVIEGTEQPPQWLQVDGTALNADAAGCASLLERLRAWHKDAPTFRSVQMDKATHEALKALGYEE
jgi:hypothetical protein